MKTHSHLSGFNALSLKKLLIFRPLPLRLETSLFVVASALDVGVTAYLLNHQQIEFGESNPVARFFLEGWGLMGMVAFKATLVAIVAITCQLIARLKLDVAKRVLYFSTLLVTAVVLYSVGLLGRETLLLAENGPY